MLFLVGGQPVKKEHTVNLSCSFCGKSQREVRKLIAGPDGLHLRRVHQALQRHHRRGERPGRGQAPGLAAHADRDQGLPRRLRHRPGPRQEGPRRRRLQPLQAHLPEEAARPARPGVKAAGHEDVELSKSNILLIGPTGSGKTLLAQIAGPLPQRPLHHRRRHQPHRGGLRGRGRREHHPEPPPQRRLRRGEGRPRHRLHRRDRQDCPQGRHALGHPRRRAARACSRRCSKIIEGTRANVTPRGGKKYNQQEYVQVDTTNILFICGGAFHGIDAHHPTPGGREGAGLRREDRPQGRPQRRRAARVWSSPRT